MYSTSLLIFLAITPYVKLHCTMCMLDAKMTFVAEQIHRFTKEGYQFLKIKTLMVKAQFIFVRCLGATADILESNTFLVRLSF